VNIGVTNAEQISIKCTYLRSLCAAREVNGGAHLVHYDMSNEPSKYEDIEELVLRARCFGLDVPVVEAGPAIDAIVLGKPGASDQIGLWQRQIPMLAKLGVKVICYNFMPQVSVDAMVIRTRFDIPTRGGAFTSGFKLQDVGEDTMPHSEIAISVEDMWQNLERFLEAVLPIAERAGVTLAMHPDDPPLTPLCGLNRIMSEVASFERLLSFSDSPANSFTLCIGCFSELGADIKGLIRKHKNRIPFVHFRNISGTLEDFVETFPDDGDVDLPGIMAELMHSGMDAYVRPDHSPLLATDLTDTDGYGFHGHLFTLGYMRGLMNAIDFAAAGKHQT
jgi:mannonate dehydratase